MGKGLAAPHVPLAKDCVSCHSGNAQADTQVAAHAGLIAFPGDMDSAARSCGPCHADKVRTVTRGLMHSGAGIVNTTRRLFGETTGADGDGDLSHLAQTPADSLLRKLCSSCHLGQKKTRHALNETRDRGGGCLACHINHYPEDGHPALTAKVEDGRCFGCHSRSGRISLSYPGLAEIPRGGVVHDPGRIGQLADGRWVELKPPDIHHTAGMSCIDCHTERDLMGTGETPPHQRDGVDVGCKDCHLISRRIRLAQWPEQYKALVSRIPFPVDQDSEFAITRNGTPLWNVELTKAGAVLHRKDGYGTIAIPSYTRGSHPREGAHTRLACSSCHSQWAPQCYGCHLSFDPTGEQWDHQSQAATSGRWRERRWDIRNALPVLGVTDGDQVVPVVPGMIMTIRHPHWPRSRFVRRFAALEPHTTGRARSCVSCHRSSMTLGLGEGRLEHTPRGWSFAPRGEALRDGLPADAWTGLGDPETNSGHPCLRPFTQDEILSILGVPVE